MAKHGVVKFLHDIVNKVWYNDLKDADTFYMKVTPLNIITLLYANNGGSHAHDMTTLRTNMSQYYVQADSITQFIMMMEDT
jgi:hypothetical protein